MGDACSSGRRGGEEKQKIDRDPIEMQRSSLQLQSDATQKFLAEKIQGDVDHGHDGGVVLPVYEQFFNFTNLGQRRYGNHC